MNMDIITINKNERFSRGDAQSQFEYHFDQRPTIPNMDLVRVNLMLEKKRKTQVVQALDGGKKPMVPNIFFSKLKFFENFHIQPPKLFFSTSFKDNKILKNP